MPGQRLIERSFIVSGDRFDVLQVLSGVVVVMIEQADEYLKWRDAGLGVWAIISPSWSIISKVFEKS